MAPATPERFGDYELVERLGVGGMAETFLAIRRPGEDLALAFSRPRKQRVSPSQKAPVSN